MYLGIVIGTVVAERKAEGLGGRTMLLVQPVDDAQQAVGSVQVAVDTVKAGPDDLVVLVGSREAALALDPYFVPVDAAIVGIVDDVHVSQALRPERALHSAERSGSSAKAVSDAPTPAVAKKARAKARRA